MNKRVKILSSIFVALFLIAIVVNVVMPLSRNIYREATKNEVDYDAFPFPPSSIFKKYQFPLTIDAFTSSFGKPSATYVDDNEGCPFGQLHNWILEDQNIELLVLGDSYETKIDYSADSRLYAFRKIDSEAASSFEDVWGIKLGDSDATVKKKLEELIKDSPALNLTQDTESSPVHCHVIGKMQHQYVLSKDGIYLFFMIDGNGRLGTIMYTTIDVRAAC